MRARRVAVIGAGLGGLAAAGRLARAGCEVTVFEAQPHAGGKAHSVARDGIVLDAGPTLLTMPKVVRETFAALGAPERTPELLELDRHCDYHFDDGCTFSVFRDLERTAESAREIRPVEARGLRAFYEDARRIFLAAGEPYLEAPFEGLPSFLTRVARRGPGAVLQGLRMGTLQELAERHFHTDHLRQFAGRFATYAGASPFEASAAFALIPWLEHAQGVHHVRGGMGALARALEDAVRAAGVALRLGRRAWWRQGGEGTWEVGSGSPGAQRERFDAVIVNDDPLRHVGREEEARALSGYVLLLDVPGRLELPHHSVFFSDDYRAEFDQLFAGKVPDDPTVYLCHPAASDPTMAPRDRSGLFVMVNAPALPREPDGALAGTWADAAARLRERVLERLSRELPGLASAKVIAERTPLDLAREGAPRGSIYGFLPHGRFGPFRRPGLRGRRRGLFFAGGGTHPGGGVPMVLLSGRYAAELALAELAGSGGAR